MGVLLWLFLIIIIVALISPIVYAIIQFSKKKPNAMNSHLNFDFREIRFGAKKDILKFDGNFVAIDCETTGLTKKDQIIEIGIVKYENFQKVNAYNTLINPQCIIPTEATRVNKITNQMVKECPKIETIISTLSGFIGDKLIVCHNASFDMKYILRDFYNAGCPLENPVACTLKISRKELPGLKNHKLETVAKYFGINSTRYHRAGDDAEVTAQIFMKLIELKKKNLASKEIAVSKE